MKPGVNVFSREVAMRVELGYVTESGERVVVKMFPVDYVNPLQIKQQLASIKEQYCELDEWSYVPRKKSSDYERNAERFKKQKAAMKKDRDAKAQKDAEAGEKDQKSGKFHLDEDLTFDGYSPTNREHETVAVDRPWHPSVKNSDHDRDHEAKQSAEALKNYFGKHVPEKAAHAYMINSYLDCGACENQNSPHNKAYKTLLADARKKHGEDFGKSRDEAKTKFIMHHVHGYVPHDIEDGHGQVKKLLNKAKIALFGPSVKPEISGAVGLAKSVYEEVDIDEGGSIYSPALRRKAALAYAAMAKHTDKDKDKKKKLKFPKKKLVAEELEESRGMIPGGSRQMGRIARQRASVNKAKGNSDEVDKASRASRYLATRYNNNWASATPIKGKANSYMIRRGKYKE